MHMKDPIRFLHMYLQLLAGVWHSSTSSQCLPSDFSLVLKFNDNYYQYYLSCLTTVISIVRNIYKSVRKKFNYLNYLPSGLRVYPQGQRQRNEPSTLWQRNAQPCAISRHSFTSSHVWDICITLQIYLTTITINYPTSEIFQRDETFYCNFS